jgi:hypothetical protein
MKEFGPIVFTIIMTTPQISISAAMFEHLIFSKALIGAAVVFSVLFLLNLTQIHGTKEQEAQNDWQRTIEMNSRTAQFDQSHEGHKVAYSTQCAQQKKRKHLSPQYL